MYCSIKEVIRWDDVADLYPLCDRREQSGVRLKPWLALIAQKYREALPSESLVPTGPYAARHHLEQRKEANK